MNINTLYQHLKETTLFEQTKLVSESEIDLSTDCFYDDQRNEGDSPTEVVLCLKQEGENLILTDKGRTREYMDAVFELGEEDVIKNIIAITNECGVSTRDKRLSLELGKSEETDNIKEFIKKLKEKSSKLTISCIGFLTAMKIFYV